LIILTGLDDEDVVAEAAKVGAQTISSGAVRRDALSRDHSIRIERRKAADALRQSEERFAASPRTPRTSSSAIAYLHPRASSI